jgi:hypothetical protein
VKVLVQGLKVPVYAAVVWHVVREFAAKAAIDKACAA